MCAPPSHCHAHVRPLPTVYAVIPRHRALRHCAPHHRAHRIAARPVRHLQFLILDCIPIVTIIGCIVTLNGVPIVIINASIITLNDVLIVTIIGSIVTLNDVLIVMF